MQSQPLKRMASGVLAAVAMIVTVMFVQGPATASPNPALQQPPSTESEALEKYRELAAEAEKINERYLKAEEDLDARKAEFAKANRDLVQAKQALRRATADEERFRKTVDRFAGASFTSGSEMNKLSALLTTNSARDFLERSSALDVIATDKYRALSRLKTATTQAEAARKQSADAQNRARNAKNAAEKLANDIKKRFDALERQKEELDEQFDLLSEDDVASMSDTGVDIGPVEAPGPAAQTAVDAALSMRGTPYVWGGTTPDGFDCSGLTQWSYEQAGISIPRNSASQSTFGTPVSRDQLAVGDLVFFNSPVSHVGMYVGDGMMVHAPTTGDVVKVSPLQDSYVGARRVA